MFEYFSKEETGVGQELKNALIICSVIEKLQQMEEEWPNEKMMDAREHQYELLQKLANLDVNWNNILDVDSVKKLMEFKKFDKMVVSYLDEKASSCESTTEHLKLLPYPEGNVRIFIALNGWTSSGYYARVSADTCVRASLLGWSMILSHQVLGKKY